MEVRKILQHDIQQSLNEQKEFLQQQLEILCHIPSCIWMACFGFRGVMEGRFHAHQLDQILFLLLLHRFVGFSTTDGYNYAAFGFMLFILHTIIWRHSALKEFEKRL